MATEQRSNELANQLDGALLRAFLVLLLSSLLLMASPLVSALPVIHAISYDDPVSLGEQQTMQATVTSDSNLSLDVLFISANGTHAMQQTAPSIFTYTFIPSAGNVSFTILAADMQGNVTSEGVFSVLDLTPPQVIATSPSGILNTQQVLLQATTDEPALCRYASTDSSFSEMNGTFDGALTNHQKALTLPSGTYTYYVRCSDGNNTMLSSAIITFTVDLDLPVLSNIQPEGTITQATATLHVTTNEQATCRYAWENVSFTSMTAMSAGAGIEHTASLNDLAQATYTAYITCRDLAGNAASTSRTFSVNLPPTATVRIEKGSPLRAGTYTVSVDTSEPVQAATLHYRFDGESGSSSISLIGSGTDWSGYLIIQDNTPNKVGTFSFQGTDEQGLAGTQITDGELFLVDTTKPVAPDGVIATPGKGNIKLRWHYDGERTKEFIIHRSTTGSADYVDFYNTATQESFTDMDIDPGVTYSYSISAVDRAGNEGPLSAVVFSTAAYVEQSEEVLLDPALALRVNKTLVEYKLMLAEIEHNLHALELSEETAFITEQGLLLRARAARDAVQTMIQDLTALLEQDLSDQEITAVIARYDERLAAERATVAKTVTITDKLTFTQYLEPEDVRAAEAEFLLGKPEQPAAYKQRNQELQDVVKIDVDIVIGTMLFMDGSAKEATLVQKTITGQQEQPVIVVELIPKEVARRVSELSFQGAPTVLNEDPVVMWELPSLTSYVVSYSLNKAVPVEAVKQTKTVVLHAVDEPKQLITGEVTKKLPVLPWSTFVLVLGIISVAGLAGYYLFLKVDDGVVHPTPQQLQQQVHRLSSVLANASAAADAVEQQDAVRLARTAAGIIVHVKLPPAHAAQVKRDLRVLREKLALVHLVEQTASLLLSDAQADVQPFLVQIRQKYAVVGPALQGTVLERRILLLLKNKNNLL